MSHTVGEVEAVRLPRLFFDDHCDRVAGEAPIPEPVHETARFVWVRLDDPGMEDLIRDAKHYADPIHGPGHGVDTQGGMIRWHHAAKRLLQAIPAHHLEAKSAMSATEYQPYYIAYAKANGLTPDEVRALDRKRHPGGCMVGYIFWIEDRWAEWRALRGRKGCTFLSEADREDFGEWLKNRTPTAGEVPAHKQDADG